MKNVFRILVWLFIALVIALALLPFVFKGKMHEAIKTEINKTVDATVDFEDVSISLIKEFPSLSIQLDRLEISGIDQFQGQNLISADKIYLKTDLISLIKSGEGINIYALSIAEPTVNLVINKQGKANYDITKDSDSTQSNEASMFGNIESYEIINGNLSYTDLQNNVSASIADLNHSGSGKFKDISFDLKTNTDIASIDFTTNGIKYMNKVQLSSDLNLGVDLENQKYQFKENLTKINDLDLEFTGDVIMQNEAIDLDLKVTAPNNKVSSIISLIPAAYSSEYSNIESTGNSFLSGVIKGKYDAAKGTYPNVNLEATIKDGTLKYPDLVFPVDDINLDLNVINNKSDLSDLSIDVNKFTFLINGDMMVGKMKLSNVLSEPHIVGLLDGTLDLKNVQAAFPMEDMTLRSGTIKSNVNIDAKAEDITNENYKAITFNGDIIAKNLDLNYANYPIKSEEMTFKLNPNKIESELKATQIGQSDFVGDVSILNPLAFISKDAESTTSVSARSRILDLDQLQSFSAGDEVTSVVDTLQDLSVYKELNINLDYRADKIVYEDYNIEQLNLVGSYDDDKLTLKKSNLSMNDEDLELRGEAYNVSEYVFNEETLSGKFYLDAASFNANKYMSEEGSTEEISEPFIVPDNLDISIYPEIKSLVYEKYDLKNTSAKIEIKDGIAAITDGQAAAMGGQVNIEGLYDTTDPKEPLFNLKYNMSKMDFSKVAASSETFKIVAPIISFVEGLFNSTLVMSGPLKQDMMPDFTQVSASGFLETLEGQIKDFGPVTKVSNAIGVDKIKDWSLKGSKNWFDLKDGKVILKPHDHQIDDMTFTVGGTHSISQDLDYKIKALIPREKLEKDKLGKNLEFGMDYLEKEARSRGVNIDLGDMIYLDIFVTGTLKSPKIKVLPVGSGGKTLNEVVKDEVIKQVNVLKDTITEELEKRTEAVKDTVTKVIEAKVDTVTNKIKEKAKTEVDKQKEALKEKLKSKLDTTVTKVLTDTLQASIEAKAEEVLGTEAKESVDSLKSKLKDWNPFKKKQN